MKTRRLTIAATAGAVSLLLLEPAVAQDQKVRLNMGASTPSSVAIVGTGQLYFVDKVKKLSAGSIDIKFFEPGALVPANQYFDAVASGSLDARRIRLSASSPARTSPSPCSLRSRSVRRRASTSAGCASAAASR